MATKKKKKKIAARKKSKKKVSKKPTRKTTKKVAKKKKKVTKKATKKKAKKKVAKKKVTKKKVARASKKKKQRVVRAAAKTGTVSQTKIRAAVKKVIKEDEKKKTTVVKKTRPIRKSKNYLNNKDLLAQVVMSKETKPEPRMSDTLARMLQMLCKRYASRGQFASYTYNEDMQAYAMMMLVRTWNSFKPEKSSNPFAFYTQCIKNSFIQFLKLEQYQRDVRDKILVKQGLSPSHGYIDREKGAEKEKKKKKEEEAAQEKKNQQLVEC